jgi:uncharacterized protein (DUF952 family)
MRDPVYHVATAADWTAAENLSTYQPMSFQRIGFIHACLKHQLQGVLDRYFAGQQNLVLLEIDEDKIESEVKYEPGDRGELFPHIYGRLNKNSIRGISKIR